MPVTPKSSRKSSDAITTQSSNILWEGFRPSHQKPPMPISEFERKYDLPFGTTRSGSTPGFKSHNNGTTFSRKPYRFFKDESLRAEATDELSDAVKIKRENTADHPMQTRSKSHKV